MPNYPLYRAAFEALSIPGLAPLARRFSKAKGIIFTLHRVLPEDPPSFSPNAILQIKPGFLEAVIEKTRAAGFEIVTLDEGVRRVKAPGGKPFVVFTFDDGYRDNLHYALPILRKHQVPFTLYVPTGLIDATAIVWWQALEDIIAANDVVAVELPEGPQYFDAATVKQKRKAFYDIYDRYRKLPEPDRERSIMTLAKRYGLDLSAHCRDLIMDWTELKTFADEPLCTIGAHSVHHYELSKLPPEQVRTELEQSANILQAQFGKRPKHLSFPIGGPAAAGAREFAIAKELGFASAVTTRPGGLYAEHAEHLTALPRISLNGFFQEKRFIDVFLTAEFFTLMLRGSRINTD